MNRELSQLVKETVKWARDLRGEIEDRLRPNVADRSLRSIRTWVESATASTLSDDDFADLYAQTVACSAAVLQLTGISVGEPNALASGRLALEVTPRRPEASAYGSVGEEKGVLKCPSTDVALRSRRAFDWLRANSNPLWQTIWHDSLSLLASHASGSAITSASQHDSAYDRDDPIIHFYERFLNQYDASRRTAHGVFYTPAPIAKYIVQQIDRCLRDDFGLTAGLADTTTWGEYAQRHGDVTVPGVADPQTPFGTILDSAVGTGAFLIEAVELIHRRLAQSWSTNGCSADEVKQRWNDYVPDHLLPRMFGLELMLPACAVAQLKLVDKLAQTGFSFDRPAKLRIHLANTLIGPNPQLSLLDTESDEIGQAVAAARVASYVAPSTVLLGNPPFSGISEQQGQWITGLLKGKSRAPDDCSNYHEVDGRPLGERKHWLHDDYVKFMRHAHWKIESAGCGIIGLITNHGYLDNPTFRGMRQQLMRTFSRITVVDLHGNRKKKEQTPQGGVDENVFAIEQGTAIGFFVRRPGTGEPCEVRHGELWGESDKKLAALSAAAVNAGSDEASIEIAAARLKPLGPEYVFVPRDDAIRQEYERGWRLADVMPVNVTAPVTARDGFVIAFTEEELVERMEQFRDLSIPDDEIRRRYFTNSRSKKYPPGDTRGWKLSNARRRMAEDKNWRDYIRPCWYRPFDRRVIFWADWMIDWPRNEVMRHMLAGDNVAIVARRQMLPTQPCNYFWITDGITLDGIIRSDNRGSESVFPLYLREGDDDGVTHCRANFSDQFVAEATRTLGLNWNNVGAGDVGSSFGPEDLAYYCYALFFSPTYRERYAEALRTDFPCIFLPRDSQLFWRLRELGARLADSHLLRTADDSRADLCEVIGPESDGEWSLARGYPKYGEGRVYVSDQSWFEHVPQDVWSFHVGGHQVCRKWLKDRRGRMLSAEDATTYRRIVSSLTETLRCMREIDEAIKHHGGWPRTFV